MASNKRNKSKPIAPADGERRAMTGYMPQYELAAWAIKAKPLGVLGAEIWAKVGSPAPTDPSQLNFLGLCTRAPFVANFEGAAGGQMAYYWVRWVNHTGEKGPWGDPVNATINA